MRRAIPCWLLCAVVAGLGTVASAQPSGAPPRVRPKAAGTAGTSRPAPVSEAERSRKLAEGLDATVTLLADRGGQIAELSSASAGEWTAPHLKRLEECRLVMDEVSAAAREGRAADVARAALKGHLIVDEVYTTVDARTREIGREMMKALVDGKNPADRESKARDFDLGDKVRAFVVSVLDLFDYPLQLVVESAPAAAQAEVFDAIAEGLPAAQASRARLEQMLRTIHDTRRDAAGRKVLAARLTSLGIAKTAPAGAPARK
jgi:hypothetical protein